MQTVEDPQSSGNLGNPVTLIATVQNAGPSIIQEAGLVIAFPSRITDITGSQYFLYPTRLELEGLGVC